MFRDEYLKRSLTDPPRHVPMAVTLELLFGGVLGFGGWFFLGFGLIFFWTFALNTDPLAWWRFRGELDTATATITRVEKTSYSEGGSEDDSGTPVIALHYSFESQGKGYSGVSYQVGSSKSAGGKATVEFRPGSPQRSRLRGCRTAPVATWGLVVVLFPAIGLIIVTAVFLLGRKRRYLLKYGELAEGTLISKTATNTEINDRRVYRMTFQFETRLGTTAELAVKSHEPELLEDDETETLLYDPNRPTYGTTLDNLPGRPQIAEDGTIQVAHPLRGWLALVLPLLTLVGHGGCLLLRFG